MLILQADIAAALCLSQLMLTFLPRMSSLTRKMIPPARVKVKTPAERKTMATMKRPRTVTVTPRKRRLSLVRKMATWDMDRHERASCIVFIRGSARLSVERMDCALVDARHQKRRTVTRN